MGEESSLLRRNFPRLAEISCGLPATGHRKEEDSACASPATNVFGGVGRSFLCLMPIVLLLDGRSLGKSIISCYIRPMLRARSAPKSQRRKHSPRRPSNRRKWGVLYLSSSRVFCGVNREYSEVFETRRPVRIPGQTKCSSRDRPYGNKTARTGKGTGSKMAYSLLVSCELRCQRAPTNRSFKGGQV